MLNDDMAESLEESDGHTTCTLKIKPGLTWHDGHPVTAHDIVYSWQQILDPDVPPPVVVLQMAGPSGSLRTKMANLSNSIR